MEIFICPKYWIRSTSRFVPTHLVSLQDPEVSDEEIHALRPEWVPPENHHFERFHDLDRHGHPMAPSRDAIARLLDWLAPRCTAASDNRFLIHCDAGLGRSPAVGYLAWALHLGPGREAEAFQHMVGSTLESRLVPNSVIITHADDLLARNGALKAPLNAWNHRVPWRRTFR